MKKILLFTILIIISFPTLSQNENDSINQQLKSDIAALILASSKLKTAWPWKPAIKEVSVVADYGLIAAPLLFKELIKNKDSDGEIIDLHIEQQIELALCKIYDQKDVSGLTVYGIRSPDSNNKKIHDFWHKIINETK
jgi:hypothetical protein